VFSVHHETTTGRLNDIAALGALCKAHGVPLLLDAVSSFAGEAIRFDAWNLEACAATANKCLHGVPGIAFVLARRDVFTSRRSGATSVYLDLFRYEKEQRSGFSPFTQATHVMHALDEALSELADLGGVPARAAHYRALSDAVRVGLGALGVEPLIDPAAHSATLTSYRLPPGLAYATLHDTLKEQGFVIYAGQGDFSGSIFRIAVMGDLARADTDRLTGCIRGILGGP
jgi:2-aminoethylphosphonate-pyruvate transaminase